MEDVKPHGLKIRRGMQKFMTKQRRKIFDLEFDEDKFDLVNIEVELEGLDSVFDGYKIINLTDIHLGQWISPEHLKGIVDYVNKLEADVITLTGDYVSYILESYEEGVLKSAFTNLKAKDKKFGVLGNHDHWLGADKIRNIFKKSDIIDLSNSVYTLNKDKDLKEDSSKILHFAGVDSVMLGKNNFDQVMKELPEKGPAILLSHEPDFAKISASTGRFGLQISGHSHGGQFIIPGTNTTLFKGSYSSKYPVGKYKIKDMIQYTSKGLGTNIFWLRVNCKPEITIFTLKPKNKKKKINVDFD
ncbi:metallophosphoesterase [Methanobrevibacter sp. DSM 116169]|uniref:metallophosphoesterase n=1 Tax=Methanobrevibacter sp. DSM 116169 TaxID=3242727 RepID=UPI0038FD0D7D